MLNLTLLVAVLIGACFATQPVINAVAGQAFGSALPAAALSVAITFVLTAGLTVATGTTPSIGAVMALPWWIVLGGVIGVLVVAGAAAIVPVTGAALFFVCFVAGQLGASVLLDHFGAIGLAVREISPLRLLGVIMAFGGVLCVRFG